VYGRQFSYTCCAFSLQPVVTEYKNSISGRSSHLCLPCLIDDINDSIRYRHIPTFGRGTIRKFSCSASAMNRLAAQDFEDLLQVSDRSTLLARLIHFKCVLPVFDGLLPEPHNWHVMALLFELAT
jgi:hypothetical protein